MATRENIFWVSGVFILTVWAISVVMVLKDPPLHLFFGGLGATATYFIGTAGRSGSDRALRLTAAGVIFGLIITLAWFIYTLAVLPSVFVTVLAMAMILVGIVD